MAAIARQAHTSRVFCLYLRFRGSNAVYITALAHEAVSWQMITALWRLTQTVTKTIVASVRGNFTGVLLCMLVVWAIPAAPSRSEPIPGLDRAELLSWVDPPSALQLLDELQPTARSGDALVQWLMARGLAYALDKNQQGQAIVQRLHEIGVNQASAEAASHIVEASLFLHDDKSDRAAAELRLVGADAALPAFVRFRFAALRGSVEMRLNKRQAALATLERARDLAKAMHNPWRMFEATGRLTELYTRIRNLDRAASLLAELRTIAQETGDEILWATLYTQESDIADARGNHAEQGRALLQALQHARRGGAERITAGVLINLSFYYLETKRYGLALDYSKQAMAMARKQNQSSLERLARFDLGMAQIGLGDLASGRRSAESAIEESIAVGDLDNAELMMRPFRTELERVGDLRGALEAWHREDSVRDKLTTIAREKALLELSAKFDDERRARQIDLLERDNTIKDRDLKVQRLRQQMIVAATALVLLVCAALSWGIVRIRKINGRLLDSTKHDLLTGLLSRRYFNQSVIANKTNTSYVGCLLLIEVDRLENINETAGHRAGDRILAAVGKRLSGAMPASDALVRWDSERFLIMTGPMSDAELNLVGRQLLTVIKSEPVTWDDVSVDCTVSIGYASFPVSGAAVDISFDRAITLVGKALQQAIRRGGDRACLITLIDAESSQELNAITLQFEDSVSDRRVQLTEIVGGPAGMSDVV